MNAIPLPAPICRCGAPVAPGRRYCSDRCCHAATRRQAWKPRVCEACGGECPKGRRSFCSEKCARKASRLAHPERKAIVRDRCRRWAETNRGVSARQPWLLGAPAYVGTLPGGLCWIDLAPEPRWPIALRNTRALHGVLTALLDQPHGITSLSSEPHAKLPAWTLQPSSSSPSGWAVYWSDPSGLVLAGKAHSVNIFNDRRTLYLSDAHRAPSPVVAKRGRRLLRVDAVTPVVIQSADRTTRRQVPEASHIASTLRLHLAPRLGLGLREEDICMELVSRETQQEWVDLGGKYGRVPGWTGHLVLDCNAVAHWLLACSATLGLGGRAAFGFGCVHVEEVQR